MDKFDYFEMSGRNLFKIILDLCQITELHESKEKYDVIDYYYNRNGKVGAEIKKRGLQCLNYPTLMMEVNKFKSIYKRIANKELDRAIYVNFIGNDVAYIFTFKDIIKAGKEGRILLIDKYTPAYTALDRGMRYKKVMMLPKEIGTKLVRKDGKWIKTL